jgi:hypothetical protein
MMAKPRDSGTITGFARDAPFERRRSTPASHGARRSTRPHGIVPAFVAEYGVAEDGLLFLQQGKDVFLHLVRGKRFADVAARPAGYGFHHV